MICKKDFRSAVKQVIENNGGNCSVCRQNINTGAVSYANMRGIKTSWGRGQLTLFIPHEITFTIPYIEIISYQHSPAHPASLEIALNCRDLISIRGCFP